MKLTTLFLVISLFQIHANPSYGQNTKVTLDLQNVSLEKVLNRIEALTDYKFIYKDKEVNYKKTVTISVDEKPISEVLNKLFSGTNIIYKIYKKQIVLRAKTVSQSSIFQKPVIISQPQFQVSGTVVDKNGTPLPGASIIEKGTTNGVTSDFDGKFSISTAAENTTLVVSYIGFSTKEISLNGQNDLNITLNEDTAKLDEVVLIGYGAQQLTKVSGSIAKAPIDELQDYPVSNFDQALAGKIAGVQVLQTSGQPGRELDIRVRGTGTITAGADPLYVVDGVPMDNPGQATEVVNMEDIESIQILKDASSAAIYGSRGGNGVVLISTKKGKSGKMKISFSHSTGFQKLSSKIDMMNAYEYAKLSKEAHDAAYVQEIAGASASDLDDIRPKGYHKTPPELYPYLNGVQGLTDTDWQDAIFRSAILQRYNLSINGGNESLNYFVSAYHSFQEGILINSDYKKTGLRVNLGINSGKFRIGVNLSPSYTTENQVNSDATWFNDGVVQAALAYSPTWPIYNSDGSYNFQGNGFWRIGTDYQHNEIVNPVALANEIENIIDHYNILGKVFVEYEMLEGLKLKSSFAVNYNQYQNEFYRPSSLPKRGVSNYNRPANPEGNLSSTNIYNWVWENTLNYNRKFGNHNLDLLGGITAQKNRSRLERIQSSVTPDTPVENAIQVVNADQVTDSDSSIQEWSLYSLLARAQYDFSNKYILSASFRADASSRFGANNKWGYFPSVSAAWRISQENFLNDSKVISELKLRASYGLTGNFQIGNYEQVSAITRDNYITGNPGSQQNGLSPSQIANPNLSWEKTAMFNTGLDLELFKNQIGVTLEYYNGNTSDLLLEVPVPQTTGFGTALQNIGEVNNTGFEFAARISPDLGKFKWTGNFNISVNKNKVKALGPENTDIITSAGTGHAFFITRVGEPIGSYYV